MMEDVRIVTQKFDTLGHEKGLETDGTVFG